MRKTLIILLTISVWGCAPKKYFTETVVGPGESTNEGVVARVISNNLFEENLFIEKATVNININNELSKYLLSLKYRKTDEFLISIRNSTGIEGARVYISEDSVFINDRIGKRIIQGNLKDIDRITGFPWVLFKALFGDLVLKDKFSKPDITGSGNSLVIMESFNGKVLKFVIDPAVNKTVSASVIDRNMNEEIIILYSKFDRSGKHIPGVIQIKDKTRNLSAEIKIEKIQYSWTGEIEFIPGKGYSKEEIR